MKICKRETVGSQTKKKTRTNPGQERKNAINIQNLAAWDATDKSGGNTQRTKAAGNKFFKCSDLAT